MEQETVTRYNYDQFLEGISVSGSNDLDLLEREDNELPEQVRQDNRRLWLASMVAVLGGAGLLAVSNLGLFAEAWPYLLGVGIAGVGMGALRLMRRVFRKKTLDLPQLELRRKTEKTNQNAMNAFSRGSLSGRLSKSSTDKVIMGVCGGLAAQSGISATLIRAIFIAAFAVTSGVAAFFYIGLGLILPSQSNKPSNNG
jgi:phage shock protein C